MSPVPEKKKKDTKEQFRNVAPLLWELVRPRRALLLVGLVLIVINRVAGLVLPYSSRFVIDQVVHQHHLALLRTIVLAVLCATAIQAGTSYALTQLLSKAAQRLISEMRMRVQSHIGRLSVQFHDANKTGALVSRIMSDVEGVRNLLGTGLVEFFGGVLTAIIALVVLLKTSAVMTSIAFGFLVVFGFVLSRAFRTIRPIMRERGKINAEVTGRLAESLGGVRVVKGYHAEAREESVFSKGVKRLLDNVISTLTATSVMSFSAAVLLGVVGSIVLYFGTREMIAGTMTEGDFVRYILFLGFLVAPVIQVVAIGTQLTEAIAGLDRTMEILRERPEDEDPRRTATLGEIKGTVEFEGVHFSYDGKTEVLHDVSFRSERGMVTALVGSSGSGKSTTIGLISAFYVPTSGRVLVDGIDLSTVRLDSYRIKLGVVLQESFLFDGTIRENVSFSRPQATEEEIMSACHIARVDEFAEKFEEKYDTIVGERGVKLSGGQRQRISIARAILAQPSILILDEATSSLDSESEALIQHGLSYLMQGRTTFVIAHRLSTIRRADQILVMEHGEIVERGTHEQLYALRGRYYELYTKQHGLESNLFLAPGEGDTIPDPIDAGPAVSSRNN
ncbi:ABC transporter, ATPase subunit [Candidatus Koribacter versatilis Ellin345]|uniref:ABC transporter, ATPase subunit n=1 Tax=Koribacter versatilis (strain Ellin345) TaxID=204669 RepID=Q1IMS1_KORVE|nr:ABC transporter ATP-binding protein [Candidatus Koribacter versatilis]ABF41829.1 ABC transporter, ATPase subunit [Candidatus Koribacter versatilis Ellin345]